MDSPKEFTAVTAENYLGKTMLAGENVNQIKRYIRLTFLIPQILQMVDDETAVLSQKKKPEPGTEKIPGKN